MDEAGEQARQSSRQHGQGQGQPGVDAPDQKDRRDGGAQGKGAVHAQVREVQNGIGDVDAEGDQRVDQTLGQGADDEVLHGETLLVWV